jgi:hypothetical protein
MTYGPDLYTEWQDKGRNVTCTGVESSGLYAIIGENVTEGNISIPDFLWSTDGRLDKRKVMNLLHILLVPSMFDALEVYDVYPRIRSDMRNSAVLAKKWELLKAMNNWVLMNGASVWTQLGMAHQDFLSNIDPDPYKAVRRAHDACDLAVDMFCKGKGYHSVMFADMLTALNTLFVIGACNNTGPVFVWLTIGQAHYFAPLFDDLIGKHCEVKSPEALPLATTLGCNPMLVYTGDDFVNKRAEVMKKMWGWLCTAHTPTRINVAPDGDCLFSALSQASIFPDLGTKPNPITSANLRDDYTSYLAGERKDLLEEKARQWYYAMTVPDKQIILVVERALDKAIHLQQINNISDALRIAHESEMKGASYHARLAHAIWGVGPDKSVKMLISVDNDIRASIQQEPCEAYKFFMKRPTELPPGHSNLSWGGPEVIAWFSHKYRLNVLVDDKGLSSISENSMHHAKAGWIIIARMTGHYDGYRLTTPEGIIYPGLSRIA